MRPRKIIPLALLDCLFSWVGWLGSIYVFTYMLDYRHVNGMTLIVTTNQHIPVIVAACVLFYFVCGVYQSLWEHPGIGSAIRIGAAVFMASFTVYVSLRLRLGFWPNPGIGVMAFYFMLTLSVAVRMYKRVWGTISLYSRRFLRLPENLPNESVRTLLIGAGESASQFLLHPSQHGARARDILGILDNDPRKHGYSLHGITIMGDDGKIPSLVKQLEIDEIVVAVPSMKNEDLRRIVRQTPVNRCKVRMLSGLSTDKAADKLRDLDINDLLGRPEAALNEHGINPWINKKTILITGGGGSIGSELCRQLLLLNVTKIVIYDISENNVYNLKADLELALGPAARYKVAVRVGSIQDERRLNEVFEEFKPSIVFHAAAFKHVPLMEECPRLAIENNVRGTYTAALCAIRHGVRSFVMISTDKAVNPTSVMGASKRMAELLTLGMNDSGDTEFVCVRFGNVLDSNGSIIPLFKRQIEAGGPVTVTHPNIIRYFMTITEAARLVLEAGAMGKGGEIFILDMGEQVKIADLAENLIRMAGLTPDIDIKIEYTGLRPGEKLYEELLLNEEGLTKTINDKIFVVRPPKTVDLAELIAHVENPLPSNANPRNILRRFVPEYKEGG